MKIFSLLSVLVSFSAFAQTEVYNEDFQTGMPAAFTIIDNDGLTPDAAVAEYTDAWILIADPDNPTDSIASSTSFFSPVGSADRWLITPAITIGSYGNILYWEAKSEDASYPDSYQILISTTDTQIASFTDTLDAISSEQATWTSRELNLSELGYTASETVHIAFVNRTNDGFKLHIDDIRVEIEDPVGLNELDEAALSVYPNPTTSIININVESIESTELFDLNGQLILTGNSSQLDVNQIEPGNYLLKTTCSKGIYFNRIVKN